MGFKSEHSIHLQFTFGIYVCTHSTNVILYNIYNNLVHDTNFQRVTFSTYSIMLVFQMFWILDHLGFCVFRWGLPTLCSVEALWHHPINSLSEKIMTFVFLTGKEAAGSCHSEGKWLGCLSSATCSGVASLVGPALRWYVCVQREGKGTWPKCMAKNGTCVTQHLARCLLGFPLYCPGRSGSWFAWWPWALRVPQSLNLLGTWVSGTM